MVGQESADCGFPAFMQVEIILLVLFKGSDWLSIVVELTVYSIRNQDSVFSPGY